MAIKLDLLPEYVPLRRKLKWTTVGCVTVLAAAAGTLAVLSQQQQLNYQTAEENLNNIKSVAKEAEDAKAEADKFISDAAPKKNAVDFMYASSRTGSQRAEVLHMVRRYLSPDAYVGEIDMSDGVSVVISASVKDNQEYGQFLDALRQGSNAQGNILYSGKPGQTGLLPYPDGNRPFIPPVERATPVQYVFPITVKAKGMLLNPVTVPADPVGAPAAGTPGAPPAP